MKEDNDKLIKGSVADSKFMQLLNENKKLKQQIADIEAEKSQKVNLTLLAYMARNLME